MVDSYASGNALTGRRVAVIGGGWAGLSAATHLIELGLNVTLFERSRILGGRSTSFWENNFGEWLDHGPHLFIGAYREALGLLDRWGTLQYIDFSRGDEIPWLMSDGRKHGFSLANSLVGSLSAIAHFDALSISEKILLSRALGKLRSYGLGKREKEKTLKELLSEVGVKEGRVAEFFQTLCLAAMNAPVELAAAYPLANALREGLVGAQKNGAIGVPRRALKEIVGDAAEKYLTANRANIVQGQDVSGIEAKNERWQVRTSSEEFTFDGIIIAVQPKDLSRLLPESRFGNIFSFNREIFQYSPIVGIHCMFNAPVLDMPFAHLHGGKAHWVFGRGDAENGGFRRISFVISHAVEEQACLSEESALSIVEDLQRRLPAKKSAKLIKHRYIRTARATVLLTPEVERVRPDNRTSLPGLFLAGDWLNTGLPATIESAARSGRSAAEQLAGDL